MSTTGNRVGFVSCLCPEPLILLGSTLFLRIVESDFLRVFYALPLVRLNPGGHPISYAVVSKRSQRARLEIACRSKAYRGFESLPLRQIRKLSVFIDSFLIFFNFSGAYPSDRNQFQDSAFVIFCALRRRISVEAFHETGAGVVFVFSAFAFLAFGL